MREPCFPARSIVHQFAGHEIAKSRQLMTDYHQPLPHLIVGIHTFNSIDRLPQNSGVEFYRNCVYIAFVSGGSRESDWQIACLERNSRDPFHPMTTRTPITCGDVARWLETLAPPHLAEDYDNVGLLVGEPDTAVQGILVALDITPEVLAEAHRRGANMVISHHPIWFRSRKSLRGDDFVSRQILYAIRHNLTLYACHTNLDSIRDGVNRTIVDRLGLEDVEFLQPRNQTSAATGTQEHSHPGSFCEAGTGMIGQLPVPVRTAELLAKVQSIFGCGCIRYSDGDPERLLKTIAVCGGAGSFLLSTARARGADAFLTADVTYHQFFETCGEMLFMDVGHYESEQFTSEVIRDYLQNEIAAGAHNALFVRITETSTNPVRYFTGSD